MSATLFGRIRARFRSPVVSAAAAALLAVQAVACSKQEPGAAGEKKNAERIAIPVLVATVVEKSMPLTIHAIGNVEPYAVVSVKSRVDGQIVKVFFADGEEVRTGQVLFQLDPRAFQAALQQAQAALQRDKAQQGRARAQEARYKDLLQRKFVSADAYAQFRTNVETADATVRADEAAVENARLQLEYSTIRSPIDGRTGKIMIQLGNVVKANETGPLVVINQVVPVYLNFAVPEQYLGEIRKYMAKGKLRVDAALPDSQKNVAVGEVAFIDNVVDSTTGTVKLRAMFPNRDSALWPGQFVTAVLTLREQHDAIVVPSEAVQTGPKGQFVFVVRSDATVETRPVKVDRVDGPQTVIAKGLASGERVVTTGQAGLVPGARVRPETGATRS